MFKERKFKPGFAVLASEQQTHYVIVPEASLPKNVKRITVPTDYRDMGYGAIHDIRCDADSLDHWEQVAGMVSVVDSEILRFLIICRVPIEKFMRHEPVIRGGGEYGNSVRFERTDEIWCV